MKKYKASYYRKPIGHEIGPILEEVILVAKNKTQAIQNAKSTAKVNDWRYLSIKEAI